MVGVVEGGGLRTTGGRTGKDGDGRGAAKVQADE